jgi:phage gp36-like protein
MRQEELREWLSKKRLVEHVAILAEKMMDESIDIDDKMMARYKLAIETNLKLAAKYCPDLKSVEVTGEGGGELVVQIIKFGKVTEATDDNHPAP